MPMPHDPNDPRAAFGRSRYSTSVARCAANWAYQESVANGPAQLSTSNRKLPHRRALPSGTSTGAGNSLLRISNSLFREKHSLIRTEQGISRRLFKSLCDFAPVSAKAVPNSLNFTEFPVIFPVL